MLITSMCSFVRAVLSGITVCHLEHVSFGGFSIVIAVNLTLQQKPLKDCPVSPMTQYPQVPYLSKLTPSSRFKMNALPMHEQ